MAGITAAVDRTDIQTTLCIAHTLAQQTLRFSKVLVAFGALTDWSMCRQRPLYLSSVMCAIHHDRMRACVYCNPQQGKSTMRSFIQLRPFFTAACPCSFLLSVSDSRLAFTRVTSSRCVSQQLRGRLLIVKIHILTLRYVGPYHSLGVHQVTIQTLQML